MNNIEQKCQDCSGRGMITCDKNCEDFYYDIGQGCASSSECPPCPTCKGTGKRKYRLVVEEVHRAMELCPECGFKVGHDLDVGGERCKTYQTSDGG